MTDLELIRTYGNGRDQGAFEELVRRHGGMVYATARRLSAENAEDIAQAVFALLAEKAGSLREGTSVAGWLYRATQLCAKNAAKQRRRRAFYEREAAAMRQEPAESAADGVEGAEGLDRAMMKLGEGFRQVILLRYLEGLSLEETAGRLGISVSAVAKRAERGLGRLRAALAKGGYGLSAGAVLELLGREGSTGLPEGLMAKLAATDVAAASGKVAMMVASAKAVMRLAKVLVVAKVAAAVLIVAGVVGGAVAAVNGVRGPEGVIVNEADPASPGTVRLVRTQMWVDEKAAVSLKNAGEPVATKSQWFVAMMISTEKLHPLMTAVERHGAGGTDLQSLRTPESGNPWPGYGTGCSGLGVGRNRSSVVRIDASSNGRRQVDSAGDGLRLDIGLEGLQAVYFTSAGEKKVPAAMDYQGKVPGGMALVFVGGFEAEGAYCLDIWEAVRMTKAQGRAMFGVRDDQWFKRTPAQWREFVDRSIVWQAKGKTVEESDHLGQWVGQGVEVRVMGVSRPARWPGCWWTPSGEPIRGVSGEPQAQKPVVALKVITGPEKKQEGRLRTEYIREWNQTGGHVVYPNGEEMVVELPDESGKLTVRVADGKWRRLGTMAKDMPLADGAMTARLENAAMVGTMCPAEVIGTGLPDGPMRLVALDANDAEVGRSWEPGLIRVGENHGTPEKRLFLPIHNLTGTPAKFALEACDYQTAKFEGIALMPKVNPPESVAGDATKVIEKSELDRKVTEITRNWEAAKKRYDAVTADDSTPEGTFKRMLEAAAAGREEDVVACFADPAGNEQREQIRAFARLMRSAIGCSEAIVAKFGLERIVRDEVPMKVPGKYDTMMYAWKIDGDTATATARMTMRRIGGHWRLDATAIAEKTSPKLQRWAEQLEAIRLQTSEGKITTTEQLSEALRKVEMR